MSRNKQTETTCDLHPSLWRAMRRKSGGAIYLPMRDDLGEVIFYGYLFRYSSRISLPTDRFAEVNWRWTLTRMPVEPRAILPPSTMPVGYSTWG